jgi:threonine dehydrogenase-like Zn-dependent dehydrogenase
LAERVNLFNYQCFLLPDKITDEAGALVEPFSATVRAVERGHCGPEDKVAIIGAGPIGLMALMAARIAGVKNITVVEIAERRIKAAELCGAAAVINPNREDPEKRAFEIPMAAASTSSWNAPVCRKPL